MNEKTKSRPAPWWELPPSTWFALLGLGLFSIVFSLWPILFDWTLAGMVRLVDFRDWPWWYYLELSVVVGFSVRWFLLYVAHYNEELDERGREEAKRFIHLTGFLAASMFLYTVLHRFNVIRVLRFALWSWLGIGSFSWLALLAFVLLLSFAILSIFFVWTWIVSLQPA